MSAVWDYFRYLEVEPTARKHLAQSYNKRKIENAERLAFQQSTRFLYTWKQARTYYQTAEKSELLIRPLLQFYGCMHLLKGLCISCDPLYPQNSKVLQHGVTTRKIKKNPYSLFEDEVRPQKEGLFSYVAQQLKLYPLSDKYKVGQLFSYFPELSGDCERLGQSHHWKEITNTNGNRVMLPEEADGALSFSPDTLLRYLNRFSPEGVHFVQDFSTHEKCREIQVILDKKNNLSLECHPLFVRGENDRWYFWNHVDGQDELPFPRWAAHYLLMYLFGMLCRYEVEFWGELVLSHSYSEICLVERFLDLHQRQFPFMIKELLEG